MSYYSMELQRIIERLCHGGEITSSIQVEAPHHAAMALELQGRIAKLEAVVEKAQAVVDAELLPPEGDYYYSQQDADFMNALAEELKKLKGE